MELAFRCCFPEHFESLTIIFGWIKLTLWIFQNQHLFCHLCFLLNKGNLICPNNLTRGTKGVFGSVAIPWLARDSHFFRGCPVFGSKVERWQGQPDSENIPQKTGWAPPVKSAGWGQPLRAPSPPKRFSSSPLSQITPCGLPNLIPFLSPSHWRCRRRRQIEQRRSCE